jgi:hypothetical protein
LQPSVVVKALKKARAFVLDAQELLVKEGVTCAGNLRG